ncbi:nuclease-related domain-containing protein [Alteromonadaceae bacterium BrNp21-10]|nr:nuclease-related domain-containing protein [Alteromonadaceae bacterium BrNp21-10]
MEEINNIITPILVQLSVPILLLLPLFIAGLVMGLVIKIIRKRSRYPFEIALNQRIPGQTLLTQYSDASADLMGNLMLTMYLTICPLACYGLAHYIGLKLPNLLTLVAIFLCAVLVVLWKIIKLKRNQMNLRLGLEAEWFTAIELYNGLPHSYKIFNDIQCDNFNIDHLVVGPNGVFAIETKGRRKPNLKATKNNKGETPKEYEVKVEGDKLIFPTFSETDTTQQAARQAKWAQKWLTQATGINVPVWPVVNIPGWFVRNGKNQTMLIASTRNLTASLMKANKFTFDEKQVDAIAYQVRQKALRDNDLI